MPIDLRWYQERDVGRLREAYGRGRRSVLYVLPTGGGKTVLFCWLIRLAVERGGRVLVLVHRRELIRQASRSLERLDVPHGVIAPGEERVDRPVQVASVQTIARRLGQYEPDAFSLIVVDEAHHSAAGSWSRVLEHFAAKRLGVTATPIRLDGRGLADHYEELVVGPSPADLAAEGHLARARVFAPPLGFDPSQTRTRMGDYVAEDAERQIGTVRALGETVEHYRRLIVDGTAIAFCLSVKHAESVAEEFRRAGIEASSIDGSMKGEERDALLERLETGDLKVLTSCSLIGEGVDIPSVNGVILLRPTKSLGLFLQMVGRGLRPSPGKEAAIVIDHVGNYARHGHHLDEREWELETGIRRRKQREAALPLWTCPTCYCAVSSRERVCPECSHVRPERERTLSVVSGSLVEIEGHRQAMRRIEAEERATRRRAQGSARTYEELCRVGRERGMRYPEAWAGRVIAARRRRYA